MRPTMTDLETRIKQWADGALPDRTLASLLRKLGEEVGELAEAVCNRGEDQRTHSNTQHAIAREAADCAIVLSDICSLLGYSLSGVMAEKVDQLQSVGSRSVPVERRFAAGVTADTTAMTGEELKRLVTPGPVCHSSAEAYYQRGQLQPIEQFKCTCDNPSGRRSFDNLSMLMVCNDCGLPL